MLFFSKYWCLSLIMWKVKAEIFSCPSEFYLCFTLPFTLFKYMNKPLCNHERLKDLGYIVLMKISIYGQYVEPLMSQFVSPHTSY